MSWFCFRKIWPRKKVSVSVSENLVSEKRLGFGFGEIGLRKKSRFWKVWSKKKSPFLFRKTCSRKRKIKNNKRETRPSKQCKSLIRILIFFCFVPIYQMEENKDCNVDIDIDVLFRRRRKRRRIPFFWRKRKPEKEKEENIWRRFLKDIEKSRFRFRS